MRVLITGGCGYIGSQLIRDLGVDHSPVIQKVRILDNLDRQNIRALMDLTRDVPYEFIEGDVFDRSALALALEGMDAVVHLAGLARSPFSFDHPAALEQANHWGTMQVVESCLEMRVPRLVLPSTVAVYGPGGVHHENAPLRPLGTFARSKARADEGAFVAIDRGLQPTILRFGVIFGDAPCVRIDTVVNRLTYLAGVGRALTVFGSGTQVRPLLHVQDASGAIRFCLDNPRTGSNVFNVVSENASVLDVVEALRCQRPDLRVRFTEQDILTHLSLEVSALAFKQTGWEPRRSLADGVGELLARFAGLDGSTPVAGLG